MVTGRTQALASLTRVLEEVARDTAPWDSDERGGGMYHVSTIGEAARLIAEVLPRDEHGCLTKQFDVGMCGTLIVLPNLTYLPAWESALREYCGTFPDYHDGGCSWEGVDWRVVAHPHETVESSRSFLGYHVVLCTETKFRSQRCRDAFANAAWQQVVYVRRRSSSSSSCGHAAFVSPARRSDNNIGNFDFVGRRVLVELSS